MTLKEVRAENGHSERVEAETDEQAFELAVEADPDIEMAGVYDVEGRPVGWDGGDPHDAEEAGAAIDAGEHV